MRKFLALIFITAMILLICGCGSDEITLSGATKTIEILLNETEYLCLEVPVELTCTKRDNVHYWEFSNGVSIYRMTSTQTTAKLDEVTGLYISSTAVIRNFDNCCVMANCSGSLQDFFKRTLASATIKTKDTKTYKEYAMKYLPAYEEKEDMELVGNMYMPPNCEKVIYDIYDSRLYTIGTDWLQSTVVDAKLADLKPRLMTMAMLNSGQERISEWYESDDIFFCRTDACVVGAKKLAFNSWYVYQGSPSMIDYILTGINKVHG